MTLYAGRSAIVCTAAFNPFNGERLSDADGVTLAVTIFDRDKTTVLVDNQPMDYDATLTFRDGATGGWFYIWTTPEDVPGAYRARVVILGGGFSGAEFRDVRPRKVRAPAS